MSRYNLIDFERRVIKPLLPNKPRGVRRVDDRRVLDDIFRVLRSGALAKPALEALLQQTPLPRAQPDRALLLQAQTLPSRSVLMILRPSSNGKQSAKSIAFELLRNKDGFRLRVPSR